MLFFLNIENYVTIDHYVFASNLTIPSSRTWHWPLFCRDAKGVESMVIRRGFVVFPQKYNRSKQWVNAIVLRLPSSGLSVLQSTISTRYLGFPLGMC